MKREGLTSAGVSNAVLATRYLALQELRERVRRAEERLVSARMKKVAAPKSNMRRFLNGRNS
jgi:hypothetical protein